MLQFLIIGVLFGCCQWHYGEGAYVVSTVLNNNPALAIKQTTTTHDSGNYLRHPRDQKIEEAFVDGNVDRVTGITLDRSESFAILTSSDGDKGHVRRFDVRMDGAIPTDITSKS